MRGGGCGSVHQQGLLLLFGIKLMYDSWYCAAVAPHLQASMAAAVQR
jgi:hypothetical protein